MAATLKVGNVELPSPTKISTSDEIIWSSNAGRSTESGKMIGDVIAEKKTLDIEWGVLTEAEVKKISTNLKSGFFPITFREDGATMTITSYRGSLKKEHMGYIGDGTYYYRSVTASIIQQ